MRRLMSRMFRMVALIALFQVLFVAVQIFLMYPCMVGAPGEYSLSDPNLRYLSPAHQFISYIASPVTSSRSQHNVSSKPTDTALPYEHTWESLEKRSLPGWYDDAKIGIFIHWGVYSVPGFVKHGSTKIRHLYAEWFWYYWKAQDFGLSQDPRGPAESVREYMKTHFPANFQYTDFAPMFTAEFFDPNEWAEIFRASGAKYIVLTSKHHDGFALWGSKRSWNWNAVDNGPHRDLIGDLANAVRKTTDIKFGLYHSLYEWFNPLYLDDKAHKFTTQVYVREKLMPELIDLVNTYKPEIVWGDGDWEAHSDYWMSKEFIAWLYNESPVRNTVVVNDRWGNETRCKHGGYLTCHDKYNPGKLQARKWENCMTVERESYGYRRNAKINDYYNMSEITEIIAQTVSYGGNVLMNIGPTPDGRIPPVFEERLRQLGQWLKVNGEAIYGSRMCKIQREKQSSFIYYTCAKSTSSTKTMYAILTRWPDADSLHLAAVNPTENTRITWLGYHGDIKWQRHQTSGILISLPRISLSQIPCQWAWVFKLEMVTE